MIINNDFLFLEVNCHFSNLLLSWQVFILLPLLAHLEYTHLSHVVVVIKIILGCVYTLRLVSNKGHAARYHFIIVIFINLSGPFSNFLYPFNEPIAISVRIVRDDPHSPINLHYLFPMRHFPRAIKLYSFELVRITISPFKLVRTVFEEIPQLFYAQLFIVLFRSKYTS